MTKTLPGASAAPSSLSFDPLGYLFTADTVDGARALAGALSGPAEVYELDGTYYAAKRRSREAALLQERGATLIPPEDDRLHMALDSLLLALQRADAPPT
jgi:hypothetical protein